jgi:hypothetical protein
MKVKNFIAAFLITFGVSLIVNVLISVFWNYFVKGNGLVIDWETGFRISLVLAIVIPVTRIKRD